MQRSCIFTRLETMHASALTVRPLQNCCLLCTYFNFPLCYAKLISALLQMSPFCHHVFLRWLSCILALAFLTLRFLSFSDATSGSWYLFAAFPYPSSAYSQMLSMATSEAEGGSSGLHKTLSQSRKACFC